MNDSVVMAHRAGSHEGEYVGSCEACRINEEHRLRLNTETLRSRPISINLINQEGTT